MKKYNPKYLSWCHTYEEEKRDFENLIAGNPDDIEMLKAEYEDLTGERYNEKH